MVEQSDSLDSVLSAIADPVRRGMLAQLRSGPASVGEIAGPHEMSFAGAAKHLKILEAANLIRKSKSGRKQMCSLNPEPLRSVEAWLEDYAKFWSGRLDALARVLEEDGNDRT